MTSQQQTLAKSSSKKELKEWLGSENFKRELGGLLPKTMSAERFVRIAFQSVHRNPGLLNTTQESFFHCLLSLGSMGLEPDGRNAHLIPFGTECTLIVDYKGIAEVLRRNHDVASIHCDVVYTRDEYEAEQGTNQHLRHIKFKGDSERGTPILAYSFVRLPDGTQEFEEMTLAEIESVRKRSKTPDKGPWVTDWDAMARKSVFKRHAKLLPLSPQTREVLEHDDGEIGFEAALPAQAAVVEVAKKRGRPPTRVAENYGPGDLGLETPKTPAEPPLSAEGHTDTPEAENAAQIDPSASGGTLAEVLRARTLKAGFSEAEMLALLQQVRYAPADATTFEAMSTFHLKKILDEEFDNAIARLKSDRQRKAKEQAE